MKKSHQVTKETIGTTVLGLLDKHNIIVITGPDKKQPANSKEDIHSAATGPLMSLLEGAFKAGCFWVGKGIDRVISRSSAETLNEDFRNVISHLLKENLNVIVLVDGGWLIWDTNQDPSHHQYCCIEFLELVWDSIRVANRRSDKKVVIVTLTHPHSDRARQCNFFGRHEIFTGAAVVEVEC